MNRAAWDLRRVGAVVALLGGLSLSIAACGDLAPSASDVRAQRPVQRHAAAPGPTAFAAAAIFETYALNALLVPLLDDDVPARWAEPSLALDCDGGRVTVDGAVLDIGAPVPTGPFVVRWHMTNCELPGSAMALSGEVELRVARVGGDYLAHVQPISLQLASADGVQTLNEPFVARMPLGDAPYAQNTRP